MATNTIQDIYQINLQGNYREELKKLSKAIDDSKKDWAELAAGFEASKAKFKRPAAEMEKLSGAARESAEAFDALRENQVRLADSSAIIGKAQNRLVRETNKLAVLRASELKTLEQLQLKKDPQIIKLRAEAGAIQKLTKELTRIATQREYERLAAEAGIEIGKKKVKQFNAEEEAAKRAAKAQNELAVTEKLRQMGLDAGGKPLQAPLSVRGKLTAEGRQTAEDTAQRRAEEAALKLKTLQLLSQNSAYIENAQKIKKAEEELRKLTTTGEKTQSVFNRISFTFRRLIGIMAAFTVARVVVREFNNMIASAIRFNASIESSRVGLAGLIAASAEVRDPFGGVLEIDQQVLRAQDIAIDQFKQLRKDALETAASYEQLSQAFQTAVAPGIQANLTVDQIRQLTVNISQAATGLGLAQDQLAEEIRSIFQGTISARNTRIATALGISNEDIRRAKETGRLFEFLDRRFAAIASTGKQLMGTFTGQLSNASDAFQQLLATSSEPLFAQLKASLAEIQQAIFQTTEEAVVFNPAAITAFKGLFDGLATGVQGIRAAFRDIDAQGFADTLAAVGETLGLIASGIANAFSIAFNLASPILQLVANLLKALNKIVSVIRDSSGVAGGLLSLLASFVLLTAKAVLFFKVWGLIRKAVERAYLGIKSIGVALGISKGASAALATNLSLAAKAGAALRKTFGLLLLPVLGVVAGITLIDFALESLGSKFTIVEGIATVFGYLNDQLDKMLGGLGGLKESATEASDTSLGLLANDFRQISSDLQEVGEDLKKSIRQSAAELKKSQATLGLPSEIADQINSLLDTQQRLSESTFEASLEIQRQSAAIKEADKVVEKYQETTGKAGQKLINTVKTFENYKSKVSELSEELKKNQELLGSVVGKSLTQQETDDVKQRIETIKNVLKSFSDQRGSIINDEYLNSLEEFNTAVEEQLKVEAKRNILLEKRADIQAQITEQERKSYEIARNQILGKAIVSNFDFENRSKLFDSDLQAATAAALAATELGKLQADVLSKQAESSRIDAQFQIKQAEATKARLSLEELINLEKDRSGNAESQNSRELAKQLENLNSELAFEERLYRARKARAELEARLAKLRESGSITQGVGFGLERFAAENQSTFQIGENFGNDLANSITTFGGTALSEAVASAFDPNRNFDLKAAAGSLLFGLGQQLITDVLKKLLAEAITGLGIDVLGGAGKGAAEGAAQGAAFSTAVTAAGGAFSVSIGTATAAFSTSVNASALNMELALFGGAAAIADAAALLAVASAGTAAARGGSVDKMRMIPGASPFAMGGAVQGFARGARARKPLGIDARDTIPAWLRPGEWVIRPESVRKYGNGFMDMLNKGQLNPGALSAVSAIAKGRSAAPKVAPRSSFATGGPVGAMPARSEGSSTPPFVLQFNDEQTMDRALAAGSKATLRFARVNRAAYRQALGMEGGV